MKSSSIRYRSRIEGSAIRLSKIAGKRVQIISVLCLSSMYRFVILFVILLVIIYEIKKMIINRTIMELS